ncbi:GRF-type domain-containing protein [Heracleum sosnowskyi]|uniref:GRF-type domain-containing protein n=1 Tax=Heracleum sosnowskyi TaxID=360622 RepID=A0AAD8JDU6_9APIA|nr:GRF-type domain-containing protein [Heracleum sosnowskyi]
MSSSQKSNLSVKNPYGSIRNSFKMKRENSSEFEYRFSGIKCKCDIESPCQEAWKEGTLDPGRRFFGCSRYKDPSKRCNFFLWVDPPYSERARDVIKGLKMKIMKKDEEIHKGVVEYNFVEKKMLVLHEQCKSLEKKNDELVQLLQKKKRKVFKYKFLFMIVLVWFVMKLFN